MSSKRTKITLSLLALVVVGRLSIAAASGGRYGNLPYISTPGAPCQPIEPPPHLAGTDEAAVRQAAQGAIEQRRQAGQAGLEIMGVYGQGDWAVIDCRPLLPGDTGDGPHFSTEGTILIAYRVSGEGDRERKIEIEKEEREWRVAYPGTIEFNEQLERLPEEYYPADLKAFLRALLGPLQDSSGVYKLPYLGGSNALVTCIDCYGGHSPAVDFFIYPPGQEIVAAADGVIETIVEDNTECCCSYACFRCNNEVVIRHPNGERSYYLHLATGSVPGDLREGDSVLQGQPIAYQGDMGYTCGSGREETGCLAGGISPVTGRHCGTHLHFEVRSAGGDKLRPRFQDVLDSYGTWYVSQGRKYISGNYYTPILDLIPPDTSITTGPGEWASSGGMTLTWSGSDDQTPTHSLVYSFRLDGYAGWSGWANVTSTTYHNLPDERHTFRVKAMDRAGNEDPSPATRSFKLDTSPPSPPRITISGWGCGGIQNNAWQNTCPDPAFTWRAYDGSSGSGSGVKDYGYYWGTSSGGAPGVWTANTSFDPTAIARLSGYASYFLNVTARDVLSHESSLGTFGVRYDGARPTLTLHINDDATTTHQTAVWLNLSANDAGSGLAEVRFSNNGLAWSGWQLYAAAPSTVLRQAQNDSSDQVPWSLLPLDRRALSVYAQVRDRAGNESAIATDTIALDLYPPRPHSASYRLCQSVVGAGGSINVTSTNYSLLSAIGQPWGSGGGFLSSITGCLPISFTTTSNHTTTQAIIASGGGLRSSASYRLGDTLAQPGAFFTSTNYALSSGFWAVTTGSLPPAVTPARPVATPIPTPAPTPGPTPTPQPASFGIAVNDGAAYTNDGRVTVRAWAPGVTYLALNNNADFTDAAWTGYHLTSTWALSLPEGSHASMPRRVYARFRDAWGAEYGPYFDDIFYDPLPPQGRVTVLGSGGPVVTLWLEAWDDYSGVAEARITDTYAITSAAWQPYTATVLWSPAGNIVYVQFRDRAGNVSPIYNSAYIPIVQRVYLPLVVKRVFQ